MNSLFIIRKGASRQSVKYKASVEKVDFFVFVWPCHPGNRRLYSEEGGQVEYHSFPATLYNISIDIIMVICIIIIIIISHSH